ncbi:hypothetical protein LY78DRAFT_278735 [Colletotrichum sublineola]|nr:hypothetical protein LY78DRAFT_278735 [Colletotrichum sublineola]
MDLTKGWTSCDTVGREAGEGGRQVMEMCKSITTTPPQYLEAVSKERTSCPKSTGLPLRRVSLRQTRNGMVRPIVVSLRCLLPKGALFFLTVRETSERKAAAEKHRHEGGKKNLDVDRDTRLPSQDTRDNTRLRSTENLQPRPGHNKSSAYEDKKDRVDADALMC